MTEYARVELRELARKMISLEKAAKLAIERGDVPTAQQLWFRRVQICSDRSRKLREYWRR